MEPLIFLTRSEFARELGVTTTRVTQMVGAGLPVLRGGRVELGLSLRWISQMTDRRMSRHPDRGCRRVDALLAGLAAGWHQGTVRDGADAG